ncbi:MAG: phosphohydrolase [Candidatus Levybacteria bacterium CG10_big_fil_rev_8_21_14_0_10_35_13]|nr:MAG: phosphohydrolase [Candidatus Levybacteria bacterium CG10_big_fil_rev_8_21_14_0_10_35_13]
MTRNEAFEILTKFVKSENLIRHHLACEAAMRGIYQWTAKNKKFPINPKDEEMWAITGLLHDADYELSKQHPEKHTLILEKKIGKKLDPGIMNAIKYHNFKYTKVEPKSYMDLAIYACDELTGLIAASALIHPDKKLSSVDVGFVLNRFNEPNFAKGADREQIKTCEEKLQIPLADFIFIVLSSMQKISTPLGL